MNFRIVHIVIVVVILLIGYALWISKKKSKTESLEDVFGSKLPDPIIVDAEASLVPQREVEIIEDDPESLLPKYDDSDEFTKNHPITSLLKDQNYLIGGYPVGIDTVVQSNKIPYLDIRSLPPVPKENVWGINQSSYEQSPGMTRKGFELGP